MRFYGAIEDGVEIYSMEIVLYATIPGIIIGLFFEWIESIKMFSFKRQFSFANLIILKTLSYALIFIVCIFFTSLYDNDIQFALNYLMSADSKVILINFLFVSALYHFIRQMNKSFGPGILYKYVTGKYFIPKEEERIFIFLDLKSSTTIAEQLGHIRYSKLIQKCFNLLTEPLIRNNGNVYQYVGDEVVVTWEIENEKSYQDAFQFYNDYIATITDHKDDFLHEFDLVPTFKAGMSSGLVTVAEVGELKSEIAYHGDVLNTAARIEGLCNTSHQNLLFSEEFKKHLDPKVLSKIEYIDEFQLKGKKQLVKVFGMKN